MGTWTSVFYALGMVLMLWLVVRLIKSNPQAFSRANLSRSTTTLGFLTLMIIGVVALGVFFLKHS